MLACHSVNTSQTKGGLGGVLSDFVTSVVTDIVVKSEKKT